MKIDMFWIWTIAFVLVVCFQSFFTVKKTSWDVSYNYVTNNMRFVVYGQQGLTSEGDSVSWASVRAFLEEDIELEGEGKAHVTVLNVHKRDSCRIWRPFWKVVSA